MLVPSVLLHIFSTFLRMYAKLQPKCIDDILYRKFKQTEPGFYKTTLEDLYWKYFQNKIKKKVGRKYLLIFKKIIRISIFNPLP